MNNTIGILLVIGLFTLILVLIIIGSVVLSEYRKRTKFYDCMNFVQKDIDTMLNEEINAMNLNQPKDSYNEGIEIGFELCQLKIHDYFESAF